MTSFRVIQMTRMTFFHLLVHKNQGRATQFTIFHQNSPGVSDIGSREGSQEFLWGTPQEVEEILSSLQHDSC